MNEIYILMLKTKKFRFTIKLLLDHTGISKDQYKAITIPLDDLKLRVQIAQTKLFSLRHSNNSFKNLN